VIGFATTSHALTELDGARNGTFFRTCQNDITTAQAVFKAMNKLGMQMFNVLYVHDSFGRAFFENMQALAAATANMTLMDDAFFDTGNKDSMEAALEKLKESESRITVVVAAADDAQIVMKTAREMGMTGKGWQYIGAGWVQSHVWQDNEDDEDQEEVKKAMQGVIGVRPDRDQTPSFQVLRLSRPVDDRVDVTGLLEWRLRRTAR
jgi:ABC-type branched-subunit amino acid transport system substrate-binding protein